MIIILFLYKLILAIFNKFFISFKQWQKIAFITLSHCITLQIMLKEINYTLSPTGAM